MFRLCGLHQGLKPEATPSGPAFIVATASRRPSHDLRNDLSGNEDGSHKVKVLTTQTPPLRATEDTFNTTSCNEMWCGAVSRFTLKFLKTVKMLV